MELSTVRLYWLMTCVAVRERTAFRIQDFGSAWKICSVKNSVFITLQRKPIRRYQWITFSQ